MKTKDVYVLFCDMVIAVVEGQEFELIEQAIKDDVINRLDGGVEIKIEVLENDLYSATFIDDGDCVTTETYELFSATMYFKQP